jgi:hypothetical protein
MRATCPAHLIRLDLIQAKSKAVPLRAMKTLGQRGDIDPTHSRPWHYKGVSGRRPRFNPQGKDPRYPLDRRMGGPRGGHKEARGKILSPLPGIEP